MSLLFLSQTFKQYKAKIVKCRKNRFFLYKFDEKNDKTNSFLKKKVQYPFNTFWMI
jgi:hypothetical protein